MKAFVLDGNEKKMYYDSVEFILPTSSKIHKP